MATQQIESEPQREHVVPQMHAVAHPMCPLSGDEISAASDLIRSVWPSNADLRFKVVTLNEPAKKEFLPYLDAEHSGGRVPNIERRAFIAYYIRNTVRILNDPPERPLTCSRIASMRPWSTSRQARSSPTSDSAPTSTAMPITMKSFKSRG